MNATSALVPPMSRLIVSVVCVIFATWAAPITPAAVPERSACEQSLLARDAVITPPLDFVIMAVAGTPAFESVASSERR